MFMRGSVAIQIFMVLLIAAILVARFWMLWKNGKLWHLHIKHCITFRIKSKIPNVTFNVSHDMVPVYLSILIFLHFIFLLYTSNHNGLLIYLTFFKVEIVFFHLGIPVVYFSEGTSFPTEYLFHVQDSAFFVLCLFLSLP